MLFSETTDRLIFTLDKASLREAPDLVVDGVYATYQAGGTVQKRMVDVSTLVDTISQQQCKKIALGDSGYEEKNLIHDDMYYLDMITFEVQQTEFLVPKHLFTQATDSFAVLFEAGLGTPEQPIKLPDVTDTDFRRLLKYLYPPSDYRPSAISWISVLRLSTRWKMLAARAEAIKKLNSLKVGKLEAIKKVQLGFECKVADWARAGYVDLMKPDQYFEEYDVEVIGLHRAVKLSEQRELRYASEWDLYLSRFILDNHCSPNLLSKYFLDDGQARDGEENLVEEFLKAQATREARLLVDAISRLARRAESLSFDEVNELGLANTVKLWKIRLEMRKGAWSMVQDIVVARDDDRPSPLTTSERVENAFGEELKELKQEEAKYTSLSLLGQAPPANSLAVRWGAKTTAAELPKEAWGSVSPSSGVKSLFGAPAKSPWVTPKAPIKVAGASEVPEPSSSQIISSSDLLSVWSTSAAAPAEELAQPSTSSPSAPEPKFEPSPRPAELVVPKKGKTRK